MLPRSQSRNSEFPFLIRLENLITERFFGDKKAAAGIKKPRTLARFPVSWLPRLPLGGGEDYQLDLVTPGRRPL